jgi:hypothetical protein
MNKNKEKQLKAILKILFILSDGEPHKISDIMENHISSKTFYNQFLKIFGSLIERSKAGEYPVYYKATPTLIRRIFQIKYLESAWEDLKEQFLVTKDIPKAVKTINGLTDVSLIWALSDIQEMDFNIVNSEQLEEYFDFFVWSTYEHLTLNLAKLCMETKILKDVNFEEVAKKLLES